MPTFVEPVIVVPTATSPSAQNTNTPASTPIRAITPLPASASTSAPTSAVALAIVEKKQPTPTLPTQVTATQVPVSSLPSVGDYFGYGMRVTLKSRADLPFVLERMKELQFKWVQFDINWEDVEPERGQRKWGELDDSISALSTAGLNLLVTIQAAPSWARSPGSDQSVEGPPAAPKDYAEFVAAFTERYKGKIQAIEVWSAPNVWFKWGHEPIDAGRYMGILCSAYSAAKRIDPRVVIVSAGLEPTMIRDTGVAVDDASYLGSMYAAGARNCSDAVGAYPIGYNNPPDKKFGYVNPAEPSFKNQPSFFFRDTMDRYRQVMTANGDSSKRIWPIRFGWASDQNPSPGYEFAKDVSREEQAEYLFKAYQTERALGKTGPMFVDNLNMALVEPTNEQAVYSLWLKNGPTLAYETLNKIQPNQ